MVEHGSDPRQVLAACCCLRVSCGLLCRLYGAFSNSGVVAWCAHLAGEKNDTHGMFFCTFWR